MTRTSWLASVCCMAGMMVAATILAAGRVDAADESERNSLSRLPGIYVLVGDIKDEFRSMGIFEHNLQALTELRLRQAGIRVLTKDEWLKTPGGPYLAVAFNAVSLSSNATVVYAFTLQLRQNVWLERAPDISVPQATTWLGAGVFGITPRESLWEETRRFLTEATDTFINDYLAANPTHPGLGKPQ